ncbi:MAG: type II toxin-antitoxin system RelE/ParE family toxin [Alphaproteobacteria bacterium]|nr:type II toxin-antitoxin system RelE/ParE family toxin [Alphaproteobacteria bacterium]
MILEQTSYFAKAMKKLRANQRAYAEKAIQDIMHNPSIGVAKKGDLDGVRVYKFYMLKQLTLLSYTYTHERLTLRLISLGSHENFYRDLKKSH